MSIGRSISSCFRLAGFLAFLAVHAVDGSAQVPAETQNRLRAIFEQGELNAKSFSATWLRDGSGYVVREPVSGSGEPALVRYDAASGNRTVLASPSQLKPQGADTPLEVVDHAFSPDGSWMLLQAFRDEAGNRVVDYWTLERSSGRFEEWLPGCPPHPATALPPTGSVSSIPIRETCTCTICAVTR